MIKIEIFENKLGSGVKYRVQLPAVPREGETLTLPDDHYLVDKVYWQANVPQPEPPPGFHWPDHVYYTIRIVVRRK